MRLRLIAAISFGWLFIAARHQYAPAFEQDPGGSITRQTRPSSQSTLTIKVPVNVVVVRVAAAGKDGKPVSDLTAIDFKVFEDGKLQPIQTFSAESYRAVAVADKPAGLPDIKELPPARAAAAPAEPRFISLVLDDLTIHEQDLFYRAVEAMKKFVSSDLQPTDQVSVISASGQVQFPFTADRNQILSNLVELGRKPNRMRPYKSDCPVLTDLQAMNIATEREDGISMQAALAEMARCDPNPMGPDRHMLRMLAANQYYETRYRTRMLLMQLRQQIRVLKHIEGRKIVVFCSAGFLAEEVRYELQGLIDNALRDGVVIHTMNPRGLTLNMISASERAPADMATLSMQYMARSLGRTAEEGPLMQLSADTGGLAIFDTNDLYGGLKQVANRESDYYVLSYATPDSRYDGSHHQIRLEVSRPDVNLTYRKGYYAPKEQLTFERHTKEDILDALHAPVNLNEIPIQLSYSQSILDDTRYQLDLMAEVSVRRLRFLEEDARHKNLVQLVVVVFDEADRYVDGYEKTVELNLSNASYGNLLKYGLASRVNFAVPAGRYKIKAIVRENQYSKMGSMEKHIEIP